MTIDLPQPRLSESDAEVRYARNRRDATAMLALADHRMLAKDWRGAMRWYGAVDYLASQGGPVSMLDRRRTLEAIDWLKARFRDVLLRELDAVGLTRAERHPRFQKSLDIMLGIRPRDQADHAWPQLPQTYFYPDLPLVDFADTAQFDWREALEGQTGPILDEALGLMADAQSFTPYAQQQAGRPQGDVHGLLGNSDWSTWELSEGGAVPEDRAALVPHTHAALDALPLCRIPSRAPTLMFSLLRPRSRIPAHTGMFNPRYICHLPLVVPEGCGFRVGGETREWRVGELMVFDDSVEHEAWNDSELDRLILIFDVWRPEVTETEQHQIEALFRIVDAH
jgi:aspartyl/asparaginyl beta-hydroxylase (cupin superfamily)